ncbi:hypothetical protein ACQR36_17315 [Rhodococcus erythropolis]|uniref:hypothetical protein n=1 Tax=Rhodococcus erythropolis TaxID=1833 RepID=UPI003D0AB993
MTERADGAWSIDGGSPGGSTVGRIDVRSGYRSGQRRHIGAAASVGLKAEPSTQCWAI